MRQFDILWAKLPAPLRRLLDLTYNLWWAWHTEGYALFERIDPVLWRKMEHNPVKLLFELDEDTLLRLAVDEQFLEQLQAFLKKYDDYMQAVAEGTTPYALEGEKLSQGPIAYFSAEYGIHESIPTYAGGLGILAGDHCKAASDRGIPLVALGLLYRNGYVHQLLDDDGRQQTYYQTYEFHDLAVHQTRDRLGRELFVAVDVGGRTVHARVWHVHVGRVMLYLLDTDFPANIPEDRKLTAELYGGDQSTRIAQEILLGIGGLKTLRAMGITPSIYHMNEGHAAFLILEQIRELVDGGLTFLEATRQVKHRNIFTTHTPIPAGHDRYPPSLMRRFFGRYCQDLRISSDDLMRLGQIEGKYEPEGLFNMTILALRHSARCNGVSAIHGDVTRRMFLDAFPAAKTAEQVPVCHVTNGVHVPTWMAPQIRSLLGDHLGKAWLEDQDDPHIYQAVDNIPDAALWSIHQALKEKLIRFVRRRVAAQRTRFGEAPDRIDAALHMLNPYALTIGFARRFAPYKRSTLLFHNMARLKAILSNVSRPVQIIFAGKAHPQHAEGKDLLRFIYAMTRSSDFEGKIVLVEDYDIDVARRLVWGVDVWLNTPRRPREASGTSGMKVAVNGGLNLSILDGWWPEGYNEKNGWALGRQDYNGDTDVEDVESLYHVLEHQVIPLYYDRGQDGVPKGWVEMMKESIKTLTPVFNTTRMVMEYFCQLYLPSDIEAGRLHKAESTVRAETGQWSLAT